MVLDKLENLGLLPDLQYLVISPSRLTISTVMLSRVVGGASGSSVVMSGYLDGMHEVAVKMISLPNAGDGVEGPAVVTLKKEMSVIVKVAQKCHFVCRYYGVSIKDNHFCLVMTKYPGSLTDHISKHYPGGKLDLPSALRIALDILNGLKELHGLGIVVLDLKPENILMTAHGTAVLTDFGISEIITSTIGMVKQSQMAGTLNYMSPEQMDYERSAGVGPSADVWALACTMIHMLTGEAPMSDMNMWQIIHKIHEDKGTPELPRDLPYKIQACLTSCLSHNPLQRISVHTIHQIFVEESQKLGNSVALESSFISSDVVSSPSSPSSVSTAMEVEEKVAELVEAASRAKAAEEKRREELAERMKKAEEIVEKHRQRLRREAEIEAKLRAEKEEALRGAPAAPSSGALFVPTALRNRGGTAAPRPAEPSTPAAAPSSGALFVPTALRNRGGTAAPRPEPSTPAAAPSSGAFVPTALRNRGGTAAPRPEPSTPAAAAVAASLLAAPAPTATTYTTAPAAPSAASSGKFVPFRLRVKEVV
ncbi:hypothetical protein CEUSTIGMA_g9365.t1 [Chlamydomonas eustigma]|uniref:Protein kinase domain-containing protein n=1 Tax=Chlamydomonas eustigma TaxID=1157962 RepID=A0A250XFU3_9CHLO|nr:hypothetical protein CEUSTIGMA_g9365.t1 [Chlamydomonas eustigma]|eukprot:GAX81937.1 hypothetical protein CEUSTIGMA_g9365.t1 [Chlamydomonas eustigma]